MKTEVTRPIISVIIPLYNGAEKIKMCLQQLDNQTIQLPFEVLIIDDASPDGSGQIVTQTALELRHSERIRVICCSENGRAGRARNIGLQEAMGDYIVFIDQDDYPDVEMLEVLYDLLEDGKYDCSACDVVDKNGAVYHRYPCSQITMLSVEKKKDICCRFGYIFAIMIKKTILMENHLRFPEQVMFEDTLYNIGWIACVNSINTTERTLYYRKDDENSQTALLTTNRLRDRVKATETYLEMYRQNPKLQDYMDIVNQFAFYYIFISCVWWMNTGNLEFDKSFHDYCVRKGHEIEVCWKDVFQIHSYFGLNKLRALRMIYYMPWTAAVPRALMKAGRKGKKALVTSRGLIKGSVRRAKRVVKDGLGDRARDKER